MPYVCKRNKMQTLRKELNFEGQNIFVGIDIHLKKLECIDLHRRFTSQDL
jgi:hypothetical protein